MKTSTLVGRYSKGIFVETTRVACLFPQDHDCLVAVWSLCLQSARGAQFHPANLDRLTVDALVEWYHFGSFVCSVVFF